VVDLARFDIALDQNVLLAEETKAEMLAPAVSTVPGRADLSHGLGWYSMEYMGTRLNWHSGWCAPSVSANIIKAPEQNLTFIIMANTDHLGVPYPHVDITYSTLGQAFYETFVYPRQSGQTVPEVNWEAGRAALVDQLGAVTNPGLRQTLHHVGPRYIYECPDEWGRGGARDGERGWDGRRVRAKRMSAGA
jgi:hypothetical protein